ncbi:hypothetical protein J2S43_000429 [Catenuloplanes nepalensis]|uniref:Secreted protein n=1 Tax=Catenuloplanes nepalensis TaxID=587533 RepID=A0ABT9MKF9_9ACTN|nr:hypothetical protein [Catenuloplanes nepalensis]MDP9791917.1 hypothetical protein [Catenuloplanes nepalensis]
MSRTVKVILAVVLLAGGIAGLVAVLGGEGLDRAEKWVSIGGVIASVVLSGLGVAVSWFAWRRPAVGPAPAPGVDVRDAKGVQIGDHNTQHNTF